GIRYRNVTGVQTCALPIYLVAYQGEAHDDAFGHAGHQRSSSGEEGRRREGAAPGIRRSRAARARGRRDTPPVRCARELLRRRRRSEERRVGKEGRERWSGA